MKDKIGIVIGIGIAAMVLATLTLYSISAGNFGLNEMLLMVDTNKLQGRILCLYCCNYECNFRSTCY